MKIFNWIDTFGIRASYLLLITSLLVLSCQPEIEEQGYSTKGPNDLTVESARDWFENNFSKDGLLDKNLTGLNREVFWQYAFEHKNKYDGRKNNIVAVPISHFEKGNYSGFKQLWIYKNSKNNKPIARVIEYIRDTKQYMKNPTGLDNFTGIMMVRDWDNNLLAGLQIENNVVKGIITKFNIDLKVKEGNSTTFKSIVSETIGGSSAKNARPAWDQSDSWCGTYTRCNNWSIDFMTYVVHGYSCVNDYGCFFNANLLDPAFSGVVVDLPTPGTYALVGAGVTPILPFGPPNSTSMGYQPSSCSGYAMMLQRQDANNKETNGFITTNGQIFMFPYQSNTSHSSYWPDQVFDSQGRVVFNWFQDPATDKFYCSYIDWNQSYPGNTMTWEIAATVHTHPIVEGSTGEDDPSPDDKNFASDKTNLTHYIINRNNIIRYTATQKTIVGANNCK
jgi:hypothetical protein